VSQKNHNELNLGLDEIISGLLKQKATSEYRQVSIVLVRNVFEELARTAHTQMLS